MRQDIDFGLSTASSRFAGAIQRDPASAPKSGDALDQKEGEPAFRLPDAAAEPFPTIARQAGDGAASAHPGQSEAYQKPMTDEMSSRSGGMPDTIQVWLALQSTTAPGEKPAEEPAPSSADADADAQEPTSPTLQALAVSPALPPVTEAIPAEVKSELEIETKAPAGGVTAEPMSPAVDSLAGRTTSTTPFPSPLIEAAASEDEGVKAVAGLADEGEDPASAALTTPVSTEQGVSTQAGEARTNPSEDASMDSPVPSPGRSAPALQEVAGQKTETQIVAPADGAPERAEEVLQRRPALAEQAVREHQASTAAPTPYGNASGEKPPSDLGLSIPASPASSDARPAAPQLPEPARAGIPLVHHVPLGAVPVEIGLKVLAGVNRFEIRLDPPELGRVEARLEIDGDTVTAQLVVDRVETLALLQRDAKTLERAFEQAGLKTSDGGVELSLRDHQADGRGQGRSDERPTREGRPAWAGEKPVREETPHPADPLRTIWRAARGVDLRI